jgi:formiminoglutamase
MRHPILLSIPHGGHLTPEELMDSSLLSPSDIFHDSDSFTDKIYDLSLEGFTVLKASVARAFVDLNRAADDLPPHNPDGVVKSHTCYQVPVYPEGQIPSGDLLSRILSLYYHPYHDLLRKYSYSGFYILGLDCHSMAASPPPIAPDQKQERPLICLGNYNGQACSHEITESLAESLSLGFSIPKSDIAINKPFSGGFITRKYGNNPIPWIQIELNRKLYLRSPGYQGDGLDIAEKKINDLRKHFYNSLIHFLANGIINKLLNQ